MLDALSVLMPAQQLHVSPELMWMHMYSLLMSCLNRFSIYLQGPYLDTYGHVINVIHSAN